MPPDAKEKISEILKRKKGSLKNALLEAGSLSWDDLQEMTWEDIERGVRNGLHGYRTIRKLLTDRRFDK